MDTNNIPTTYAYIDEAGAKGFERNVRVDNDNDIGLISAIIFPPNVHDKAKELFTPGFLKFQQAAPPGAKIHFTDAYTPGNEAWADVANEVREDFIRIIYELNPIIVYTARRLRHTRENYKNITNMIENAKANSNKNIKIIGSDRPNKDTIEEDLMLGLTLRIDAFGEICENENDITYFDLYFDQIDDSTKKKYEGVIERTKNLSTSTTKIVNGWDSSSKQKLTGTINTKIHSEDMRLDTQYVQSVHIAGKNHPLVLVADLVANLLYRHLKQLDVNAPLNAPSSILGWRLEERVYGTMDGALEDLF